MIEIEKISTELLTILQENLKENSDNIQIPPPIFEAMKGEVMEFDLERGYLKNRFPVLNEQLNPYGKMQGGMIAAAIDNTLGPLSLLVAPPNFTRHLEVKYKKIVSPEIGYIYVTGIFLEKKKGLLFFQASVANSDGDELASAKATHWIIDGKS